MNYKEYNDYELLSYVSEQNEEAMEVLYKKYMPLITTIAKKMYNYTSQNGIEVNDLIQEGMLGLSRAICEYRDTMDASFYTFAKTCIERKIISAVVKTRRQKHKILNDSIPFEVNSNGKQVSLEDFLGDNQHNPEYVLLDVENYNEVIDKVSRELTDFEMQVFELRISGLGYKEIASILEREQKAIDNCLQRIKMKVKKILADNDDSIKFD